MRRLLTCALVLLAVACTAEVAPVDEPGAPKRERTRRPKPVASTPPETTSEPALMLVYVRKTALRGHDTENGTDHMMRKVPGPDLVLSPDGTRIALVTDKQPGADPEGFAEPVISVAPSQGKESPTDLGPGRSPQWSAAGTKIAAVTDEGVVSYDAASGESNEILTGAWGLLGWSGDRVAALGQNTTVLAAPGDREDLGFEPMSVWGISTVDDTALLIEGARPVLMRDGETIDIDSSGALGDGAWSPDGALIAAVRHGGGPSRVIAIDAATGATEVVEDSAGAQGNVVWAADSQTFAFVRVHPRDNLKLQAVVCKVDGRCTPAFSWAEGVLLLGFGLS